MNEFLSDFFAFLASMTPLKFIRMFWFFFLFDFVRYILIEAYVISVVQWKKHAREEQYSAAREKLFKDNPLVSVIAPGKNEGKHIPRLAESLKKQSYKNIEIIVVDDGSTDTTREICTEAARKGLIDKFFSNTVRGGKASAANLALRYARGKYIVHLDADSHLYFDAIERLIVEFYMDETIGAVGGDIRVNNPEDSLAASLQAIEYGKSISVGRRLTSYLGLLRIISGAFGAFRKDVLDRIGGWDVGPGLDGDITLKYRKLGYKVTFVPEAVCFTNVPVLFAKLWKQRYRWNRSLVRFRFRKHFDLFLPTANYRLTNMLSAVDNTLFNFVLNMNWWIYFFEMLYNFHGVFTYILIINYLLYIVSNAVQHSFNLLLAPNPYVRNRDTKLSVYLAAMPLYSGIFLRTSRTIAHLMEIFFKKSYEDAWNPWKVSKVAKEHRL